MREEGELVGIGGGEWSCRSGQSELWSRERELTGLLLFLLNRLRKKRLLGFHLLMGLEV